ncbi:unnamed protein product [Brachionus calyciflorus]|uniref:Actin-interacting protein 1 n=1 Tax=Brachionus calyciflorus TaxID=104777 RepID=A0A814D4Y8_9BILA|nr:unnamed protein product [Brachionus calyciflorus]
MSYSLTNIFASLPRTTRGAFTLLSGDPKGKNFLYVNGNSVFIRNIDNPLECDVYTEHSQQVNIARYSPSGFYIASADQSGKVRIWDTVNKEHILKNEFQPLSGSIKDLQWSSDNQRILVGGEGREKFGHVFSADTGTSTGEIMGTSKPINSVDLKPTRPFRCVVASEDNSLCYFEGPPFKWKKTLNEHQRFVNVVRYSPNGEKFASGGADGKLFVYDGKTGDFLYEIKENESAHNGGIYSLCWDPTSQLILTVSGDKTAKLWKVEEKLLVKEFKFGDGIEDQQVGCLWQNNNVLTVSLSGQINYINYKAEKEDLSDRFILKKIKGHSKSITALEVAYQGTDTPIIFSGSHDGVIVYWNSVNGEMDQVKAGSVTQHKNQVQSIRYDAFNEQVLTCGFDDVVKFIDVKEKKYVHEIRMNSQPQGLDVNKIYIVIACINQLVLVKDRKVASQLNLDYESISVSITRNSNFVAVGGRDNKVHIYEIVNDSFVPVVELPERDFVTSVRYSNSDEYLAVADNAKNIKCYKIDGKSYNDITKGLWQHHAGKITNLSWSPDSTHLASSSVDTHTFVYTPAKVNEYIHIKNAHPLNPLTSNAWLNNTHLITSSQDCCIRKWKLNF